MSARFLALSIALLAIALCSCTNDGVAHGQARLDTPKTAAQSIVSAIDRGDREAFLACMTKGAARALESGGGFDISAENRSTTEVGEPQVNGSEAAVPINAEENGETRRMTLLLRRIGDEWRMYGIRMSVDGEGEVTVDFQAMAQAMDGVAEQLASSMQAAWQEAQERQVAHEISQRRRVFESLVGMDPKTFDQSWRVTSDPAGATVGAALETLAGGLGLALAADDHREALAAAVTTPVEDVSKMEAIERLCEQVGLAPVWPSVSVSMQASMAGETSEGPASIALEPRGEDRRVAFAGPFAVVVSAVDQQVPHARGRLELTTTAYGVNAGVLGTLQNLGETVTIDHVLNPAGESVMAQDDIRFWGGGIQQDTRFEDSTHLDLKNLLQSVDRIASVEGTRRVRVPLAVESVDFDSLRLGHYQEVGALKITVAQVNGTSLALDITGPEGQLEGLTVVGRALDAAGDDLQVQYDSTSGWTREKTRYDLTAITTPSKLRLKIVTRSKVIEYPFSLKNIPLDRHDEMPAVLEALSFEGAQPVAVRFLRFDHANPQFPEAELEVTNHTNKPVLNVYVRFVYTDGQQKKLGDHLQQVQGNMTMEGHEPLAEGGATITKKETAFFRPEGTQGMKVEIESVEFMDGTHWPEK